MLRPRIRKCQGNPVAASQPKSRRFARTLLTRQLVNSRTRRVWRESHTPGRQLLRADLHSWLDSSIGG